MKNFANNRPEFSRDHIKSTFNLTSIQNLSLELEDIEMGSIELNNERSNAIKGFKDDVESGDYPNSDHTVDMLPGEKEALLEKLDNF